MIKAEIKEVLRDKQGATDKVAIIKDGDRTILTISLERNPEAMDLINVMGEAVEDFEIRFDAPVESKSKLQQYRELAGLTHEELGNMAGCSRQTIVKIENKTSIPKLPLAIKIADALNMDVRELL